jgi:cation transport regulator ChaB
MIDNYNLNDDIDNRVSDYSNKNIKIIMKYFGSIYKALKSYKDKHDKYPDDEGEEHFYASLAYHSFREMVDEEELKKI